MGDQYIIQRAGDFMTETAITKRIIQLIRDRGHWCVKLHGGAYQQPGLPDLTAVVGGVSVWIEVKRANGKPTKLQLAMLRRLKAAGAVCGVAYNVEDAEAIIERAEQAVERLQFQLRTKGRNA